MLTAARLRELLHYDPETGTFTRLASRMRPDWIGKRCGWVAGNGYILICVDGVEYYAHRLAWLWMTGCWPNGHIDHANRARVDNRWNNLREADWTQQAANSVRHNKVGFKGVYGSGKMFCAAISCEKIRYYLGSFTTAEEALAAYVAKAKELFGEFACAG